MKSILATLVLTSVVGLGSCSSSKSTNNVQAFSDTLTNCFPTMFERLQLLLDIAQTWRQNATAIPADPAGLTFSENSSGVLQVDLPAGAIRVDMQITFYNASGVAQDIDLTGATTLGQAIDLAATALATAAAPRSFLTADWSLRDAGNVIFGAGTWTGILGGSLSQVELERISSTLGSVTVSGGPPAAATSTISSMSGADLCVTRVDMPDLQIDTTPTQQYPAGVVTFTITRNGQDVVATATFNQTNTASITVGGIPTSFSFNLDTLTITAN